MAITGQAGSGAAGTATITKVVSAITVTSGGSGYANPPTVEFSGGGGTGAAADATVPTPGGLAFAFGLPAGWALVSTGGANVPAVASPVGPATTLEYAYIEFPANSATFTVTVSYPSGLLVNQTITPSAIYRSPQAQLTVAPLVFTPPAVAPAITTQPASVTVASGANTTFSVVATGTPTPTLKWQRSTDGTTFTDLSNGAPYSGVTTTTLTVSSVTLAMTTNKFRAIATNGTLPDATSTGRYAYSYAGAKHCDTTHQPTGVGWDCGDIHHRGHGIRHPHISVVFYANWQPQSSVARKLGGKNCGCTDCGAHREQRSKFRRWGLHVRCE